jgi:alpha-tubulin suppressor-like RCC1 family protein
MLKLIAVIATLSLADINVGSNDTLRGQPVRVDLDIIDESNIVNVTWEVPWDYVVGENCSTPGQCNGVGQVGNGSFTCDGVEKGGIVYRNAGNFTFEYFTNYTQVSAGTYHTCAILSNGSAACWGDNGNNQTDVPAIDVKFTQVSAGGYHTCAILSNGSAICWGINDGTFYDKDQIDVPTLDPGVNFTQVSAGGLHSCAVLSNGSATCWGANGFYYHQTDVPILDSGVNFTQISAGSAHTCTVLSDGSARCWGDDYYDQTNVPTLDSDVNFTQVSAGYVHTCAVLSNGSAICWGINDNSDDDYNQTDVPDIDVNFTQVSAGDRHTCAVLSNGSAICWGLNDGFGRTVVPPDITNFEQISAGGEHTCAVLTNNTIKCWGKPWQDRTLPIQDLISITMNSQTLTFDLPCPTSDLQLSIASFANPAICQTYSSTVSLFTNS